MFRMAKRIAIVLAASFFLNAVAASEGEMSRSQIVEWAKADNFNRIENSLKPSMAPGEFGRLTALARAAHAIKRTDAEASERLQGYVLSELGSEGREKSSEEKFTFHYQRGTLLQLMGLKSDALNAYYAAREHLDTSNLEFKILQLEYQTGKGGER